MTYLREKEKGNSLDEYYAFSGTYLKSIDPHILLEKLRYSANLNSSFNIINDNSISRPPSSAQVGLNYKQINTLGQMEFSTGDLVILIHL